MKISIDTKEDSHEDIRKVIKMLKHLVGEDSLSSESNQGNIFDSPNSSLDSSSSSESSSGLSAFGAMFGDDSPISNESSQESPKVQEYDYFGKPIGGKKPVDAKDLELVPYQ